MIWNSRQGFEGLTADENMKNVLKSVNYVNNFKNYVTFEQTGYAFFAIISWIFFKKSNLKDIQNNLSKSYIF